MSARPVRAPDRHRDVRFAVVIVLLVALVLFAALAAEVAYLKPLVSLDRHVGEELNERATPWVTTSMEGVSLLGSSQGLLLVTIASATAFASHRRFREAALVLLALAGAELIYTLLKVEFARPRPSFADPVVAQARGYSFPSGHATASMAVYAALSYVALTIARDRSQRIAAIIAATTLVAAIGFSRIYLGKHFVSDVIGGWLAAAAWLAILVLLVFAPTSRRTDPEAIGPADATSPRASPTHGELHDRRLNRGEALGLRSADRTRRSRSRRQPPRRSN